MRFVFAAFFMLMLHSGLAQLFKEEEMITQPESENDDKQLILLVELTRHGARSPIGSPDQLLNTTWNIGKGQLTRSGERQHYLQGVRMRKKYIDQAKFLPDVFNPQNFYIMSTDYNRTIMSAFAQMQGLYPLGKGGSFVDSKRRDSSVPPFTITDQAKSIIASNDVLPNKYVPYPIHVAELSTDNFLRGYDESKCLIIRKYKKDSLEEANARSKEELSTLYDELFTKFKVPKEKLNLVDAEMYIDTYVMAKFEGMKFEKDLSVVAQNLVRTYYKYLYYDGIFGNPQTARLSANNFLRYLNENIKAKVEAFKGNATATEFHKNIKHIYFSAHDTTLAGFLSAIGQAEKQVSLPPLASLILIEVYKREEKFYLNWNYNGEYLNINGECTKDGE
mmetsp:Transcript_25240/g.29109  ORF Transcript_25240/g.29109 Transcript_25240/m.29109 type:complete len:391 (+) Transcript_25240:8-1180(+)